MTKARAPKTTINKIFLNSLVKVETSRPRSSFQVCDLFINGSAESFFSIRELNISLKGAARIPTKIT